MEKGTVVAHKKSRKQYAVVTNQGGWIGYIGVRLGKNYGPIRSARVEQFARTFIVIPERVARFRGVSWDFTIEIAPRRGACAEFDKSGQHGCVLPAGHEGNHESSDSYRGHPATQFDRNGWIVRTLDQVKEAVEVELNDRFGYCAGCGGEEYVLVGRLGNRVHVRCRNCGLDASAEVR
jgi:hypothetical protein